MRNEKIGNRIIQDLHKRCGEPSFRSFGIRLGYKSNGFISTVIRGRDALSLDKAFTFAEKLGYDLKVWNAEKGLVYKLSEKG